MIYMYIYIYKYIYVCLKSIRTFLGRIYTQRNQLPILIEFTEISEYLPFSDSF